MTTDADTTEPVKVFVARDFSDVRADALLEGCRTASVRVNGRPVEWIIPDRNAVVSGRIGHDIVKKGIDRADMLLALTDVPNANVGWEAGYALGLGKPVRLGQVGVSVTWCEGGSLSGRSVTPLLDYTTVEQLLSAIDDEVLHAPSLALSVDADAYLLCPGGIEGAAFRQAIVNEFGSRLILAPPGGQKIAHVAGAIQRCRQAVWIVCLDADVRDGPGNASNGVVAGMLRGWGGRVDVLRSWRARSLADLAGESYEFDGWEELAAHLRRLVALRRDTSRETSFSNEVPQVPLPTGQTSLELRKELERVFPYRSDIDDVASRLRLNVREGGSVDQIWEDLFRQLFNRRRTHPADAQVLLSVGLNAEPDNPTFRRLAFGKSRR